MQSAAPILPSRDSVGIHFFLRPELDPWRSIAGCYLYVEDADALHAELPSLELPSKGIPRLHGAPEETEYGLREFALVDPEGNLLRMGSSAGR